MDISSILRGSASLIPGALLFGNGTDTESLKYDVITLDGDVLESSTYQRHYTASEAYLCSYYKISKVTATLDSDNRITAFEIGDGAAIEGKIDQRYIENNNWWLNQYGTEAYKFLTNFKATLNGGIKVVMSKTAAVDSDNVYNYSGNLMPDDMSASMENNGYYYNYIMASSIATETCRVTLSDNFKLNISEITYYVADKRAESEAHTGNVNLEISGISGDLDFNTRLITGKSCYLDRNFFNYSDWTELKSDDNLDPNDGFTAEELLNVFNEYMADNNKPALGEEEFYGDISVYYIQDGYVLEKIDGELVGATAPRLEFYRNGMPIEWCLYNNKPYVCTKNENYGKWKVSEWNTNEYDYEFNSTYYENVNVKNPKVSVTGRWNEENVDIKKLVVAMTDVTKQAGVKYTTYKVGNASVDVEISNASNNYFLLDTPYGEMAISSAKASVTGASYDPNLTDEEARKSAWKNSVVDLEAKTKTGITVKFNSTIASDKAVAEVINDSNSAFTYVDSGVTFNFKSAKVDIDGTEVKGTVFNYDNDFNGIYLNIAAVESDGLLTTRTYKVEKGKLVLQSGNKDKVSLNEISVDISEEEKNTAENNIASITSITLTQQTNTEQGVTMSVGVVNGQKAASFEVQFAQQANGEPVLTVKTKCVVANSDNTVLKGTTSFDELGLTMEFSIEKISENTYNVVGKLGSIEFRAKFTVNGNDITCSGGAMDYSFVINQ